MSDNNSFYNKVYNVVINIPKGKVATYGQIAALSGNPKASRVVGTALHNNPKPGIIPCHRVVNRFGRLAPSFAFGGKEVQRKLLEDEGVEINEADGEFFVNLSIYQWDTL